MFKFKTISNEALVQETKQLVKEERELTARIIECLEEIYRRDLFRVKGYDSLQSFCELELGYSGGSAARRIAAMRVIKDVPQAKPLYEQGLLTLETLQMVQIQSRQKGLSLDEKKSLVQEVKGKTKEEVRQLVQTEKTFTVTLTETEYEILQELKARLGTSKIETILRESLKLISPRNGEIIKSSSTRTPTASQKRALYRKNPKCSWPSGCSKEAYLEVDHITAWSVGGETVLENLQLLCSAHNQLKDYERTGPYLRKKE
jgi:hypothetical protein